MGNKNQKIAVTLRDSETIFSSSDKRRDITDIILKVIKLANILSINLENFWSYEFLGYFFLNSSSKIF